MIRWTVHLLMIHSFQMEYSFDCQGQLQEVITLLNRSKDRIPAIADNCFGTGKGAQGGTTIFYLKSFIYI